MLIAEQVQKWFEGPMARTTNFPDIPEAVAQFRDGTLSENDFMRAVLAYPVWRVAAQPGAGGQPMLSTVVAPSGGRILELFSSPEMYAAFAARELDAETPAQFYEAPGFHLLQQFRAVHFDRINFDMHSPHAFHYEGEPVQNLKLWAEIVGVELAIARPDAIANPLAILRRYQAFFVVLRRDGAERDLVLAPDNQDRAIAAVFTAADTAKEFIEALDDEVGQLELVQQSGDELFIELRRMPLDGLVFNPASHLVPVAFRAAILDQLVAH